MTDRQKNIALAIAIAVGAILFLGLVSELPDAKPGEIAQSFAAIIGGILGGLFAAVSAFVAVRETLRGQSASDAAKAAIELASIRLALRTEVGMIAGQCLMEFQDWRTSKNSSLQQRKNPRTAILPPLTIYDAVSDQIGKLERKEIVPLISFASTRADIVAVATDMMHDQQSQADKEALMILFSNACGYAAQCLEALPEPDAALDQPFVEELKKAWRDCQAHRRNAAKSYGMREVDLF